MNYYELFGIPESPVVDRSLLAKKYFELQRQSHPDYFIQANEQEQADALERSAAINRAFNIFSDDDKTIEYFLQHTGIMKPDEKYELPSVFLMEMMDLNESMHEDSAGDVPGQVEKYEKELKEEISPVMEAIQAGKKELEHLQELKAYYFKKKYLKRILDRLGD